MNVIVSLDALGRWRWQLQSHEGLAVAESCDAFSTYTLAVHNATRVCDGIPDAPVEVQRLSAPLLANAPARLQQAFEAVCRTLHADGLEAALELLNRPLPHRYTAVYWMPDAQRLVNVAAFDKLGAPYPAGLQSVPYNHSFCQYAIRDGQFRTVNSALDIRLDGHAYQGVLNAYQAVPLVSADGQVVGTLCHFDAAALPLDDEAFELLRLMAPVIVHFVPKPDAMAVAALHDAKSSMGATDAPKR